nr:LysR substrate-binding domain-containing protein [Marinobacter salexigens]
MTSAGKEFLTDARAILSLAQTALERARNSGIEAGQVDIGLSGSHLQSPLTSIFANYMKKNPNVSLSMHQLQPSTQIDELRSGRIDLSLSRTPVNDDDLKSTFLWHDILFAAFPSGHPMGGRDSVYLNDLKNEKFVMLRLDSSAYSQHIYDCCVQSGFTPKVVQWVNEIPAIISLISAGLGVGLIPRSLCHTTTVLLDLVALTGDVPKSSVYVVQQKNKTTSVIEGLVHMLRNSS